MAGNTDPDAIELRQSIAELIAMYPQARESLRRKRLFCPDCYLMRFCSVEYAARSCHLNAGRLLAELAEELRS